MVFAAVYGASFGYSTDCREIMLFQDRVRSILLRKKDEELVREAIRVGIRPVRH